MIKAIRARITAAFAAFITMSIVAMAFLSPTVADARGGFSGGGRASFSVSRAYVAPRVYIAPRPVIVVRPRPVVIVPVRPYYTPRPVIVPFVQPTVVVPSDGGQQPVVIASGHVSHGFAFVYIFLIFLLLLLVIGGGGYYGYCYVGGMTPFDVDAIICADLAFDAAFDCDY